MPVGSMIADLWDWDIQLDDHLGDDWYFGAIFGPRDQVEDSAQQLADFFRDQCRRLDLDYDQHSDPEGFEARVFQEATEFVRGWRSAALAVQQSRAPDAGSQ